MNKAINTYAAAAVIYQCNASKLRMMAGMIQHRSFDCECLSEQSALWNDLAPAQQQTLRKAMKDCREALKVSADHHQSGERTRCREALQAFIACSGRIPNVLLAAA